MIKFGCDCLCDALVAQFDLFSLLQLDGPTLSCSLLVLGVLSHFVNHVCTNIQCKRLPHKSCKWRLRPLGHLLSVFKISQILIKEWRDKVMLWVLKRA